MFRCDSSMVSTYVCIACFTPPSSFVPRRRRLGARGPEGEGGERDNKADGTKTVLRYSVLGVAHVPI